MSYDLEIPAFLAFGDLGVDSVARIDHLPHADEKLWVEPSGDFSGGMMGNAAVAAASLGITAGVVALVGSDDRGRIVLDGLEQRGIDTRFVREVDAPTFWTLSLTVANGDRTLIQFPTSAFGCDWEFDRSILSRTRWVHTVAEAGGPVASLLQEAHEAGPMTSLDIEYPFVLQMDLPTILPSVDVAFLNAGAAETFGGPEAAARDVLDHGARTVLITLGADGAFLASPDGSSALVPAYDAKAIDTNGAGDAFAGAYAAGVLKGFEPHAAVELAVFVAGLSTTAFGGHGPEHSLDELRVLARSAPYEWWDQL
jgi:ribokinase